MTEWIRERKAAPFVRRTPTSVQGTLSGFGRRIRVKEAIPAEKKGKEKASKAENRSQTSLIKHLVGSESSPIETQARRQNPSHADLGSSSPSRGGDGAASGRAVTKRRRRSSTDAEDEETPSKRTRRSSDFELENEGRQTSHSTSDAISPFETETQPLAWDSDDDPQKFSPKKAIVKRTKSKRIGVRTALDRCAPAISPKKRKALIEQSAKDIAMQQHRQSKRIPFKSIVNESVTGSNLDLKRDKRRGRSNATPSPLRRGFSMLEVNESSEDELSETEEEDSDGFFDPPSPLSERSSPASKQLNYRPILSSSSSERRIYAFETQNVDRHSSSAEKTDNEDERVSGGQNEVEHTLATRQEVVSSQTAPGGSWSGHDSQSSGILQMPEYANLQQSIDQQEGKAANTDATDPMDGAPTIALVEAEEDFTVLANEETQPLPWETASMEAASPQVASIGDKIDRAPRKAKNRWSDINQVWSDHLESKGVQRAIRPSQQSNLVHFGFSRSVQPCALPSETLTLKQGRSPISDAEDVPSESEEDDNEQHNICTSSAGSRVNRLQLVPDEGDGEEEQHNDILAANFHETQPLHWSDDEEETEHEDEGSSVPSDSGLDSQIRQFLQGL